MLINDLISLKKDLNSTKIGHMTNEGLRAYLKLSIELNKYEREFEEKKQELVKEALATKGYDVNTITKEQDQEIGAIVIPILNEYLATEVDVNTKILSWDDLYQGILDLSDNNSLTVDVKSRLTDMLCSDPL